MLVGGMRRCVRQVVVKTKRPTRIGGDATLFRAAAAAATSTPLLHRVGFASKAEKSSVVLPHAKAGRQSTLFISQVDTESLIERTRNVVIHALNNDKISQRLTFDIFQEWRHILFHLPKDDRDLLTNCAESIDSLLHATLDDKIFKRGKRRSKTDGNLIDYVTTGVYAWGRVARLDSNAPKKAERLVLKLQELTNNVTDKKFASIFAAMVYCWSQAVDNPEALERASHWFRQIETGKDMTVNPETFNAYLRTIVRHGQFHSQDTRHLLKRYSSLQDGYTYSTMVRGWLDSNQPKRTQQAYEVLQEGVAYCMERPDEAMALQQLLFDYFSQTAAQHKNNTFNEGVLLQMIALQQSNPDRAILQRKHFVVVMSELASLGDAEGVKTLFDAMQELHEQGVPNVKPDYQVLVIVLSALAKTNDCRNMELIDNLLVLIEQQIIFAESGTQSVTNHAFNVALDFYSRVPGIANRRRRIEALMHQMEEWAGKYDNSDLLPDRISYASLLRAIIGEKEDDFAMEINNIVEVMESSDRPSLRPDLSIYSLVLDGFFQSGDPQAVAWAERLKERSFHRCNVPPDEIFYTILMKIYSLSGDAESSDEVLSEMIAAFEGGNYACRPTEVSFVTAMSTWERSGKKDAPDAALRLFNRMMSLYESGIQECRPTLKTFGQLMVILAKSNHATKRHIARRLLNKMKDLNIASDLMVLNWYIRVCGSGSSGSEQDRDDCWRDAQATLEVLRKSRQGPNSHTYNSMLHACHSLFRDNDDQRLADLQDVFEKCKEDGLVDKRIVSTLKRLLPPQAYEKCTTLSASDQRISMHKLPQEWQTYKTPRQ